MNKRGLSFVLCLLAGWAFPFSVRAEVKAHVDQIQLKLTEQDLTQVQLRGRLQNRERLPIRGVQVRIRLFDPQNQPINSFLLEPFEHLASGQEMPFQAEYLLKDYPNLYLKAQAEVSFTPTSYLQLADWFVTRNWHNLRVWQIPVSEAERENERTRLERALTYLEQVPAAHEAYSEARRKWNLIHFTYGKRLAEAQDGHEAILRLANVEPGNKHYAEAQELIERIRSKTLFDRAIKKALEGNLRGAYRQLLYLPEQGDYAQEAAVYRNRWRDQLKAQKVSLGPITPPAHLRPDERNVWLRRQHGPEGYTTSIGKNGKRLRTWWYLDYSFYTFDDTGRLVNRHEF